MARAAESFERLDRGGVRRAQTATFGPKLPASVNALVTAIEALYGDFDVWTPRFTRVAAKIDAGAPLSAKDVTTMNEVARVIENTLDLTEALTVVSKLRKRKPALPDITKPPPKGSWAARIAQDLAPKRAKRRKG